MKPINLDKIKYKIALNYINILIYLLFFQLWVQPYMYTNYSYMYTEFNNMFFLYNFIANILNTSIFGFLILLKKKSINYFLYSLITYSIFLILFIDNIEIYLFTISILAFDIAINILRLQNKDKWIIIFTLLNILLVSYLITIVNPYLAYGVVNIVFFTVLFFITEKGTFSNIKIDYSYKLFSSILLSIFNNIIKISDRYADKVIFLALNITNQYEILPLIIVSGLIVMPMQLVSKILMSTHTRISLDLNNKMIFLIIFTIMTTAIIILQILKIKYNIDILNDYLISFILILLYKFLNSYNIFIYSSNYERSSVNIYTIILFLIFTFVFIYLIFSHTLVSANTYFIILVVYFIILTFLQKVRSTKILYD